MSKDRLLTNYWNRQYIQEAKGYDEAEKAATGGIGQGEKISRSTLEDEARESTLSGHGTPAERFWQRQRGQDDTIAMGKQYIAKVCLLYQLMKVVLTFIGGTYGDEEREMI